MIGWSSTGRAVVLAVLAALAGSAGAQSYSQWVYPGDGGQLVYVADGLGNRIANYSRVGYHGGLAPIPNVPVRVTVTAPASGDAGARIQAAIDQVAQMSLDQSGFRGAVLLKKGIYSISGQIKITASGIVLRGEGASETGTVLRATGTGKRTLLVVQGSGSPAKVTGTEHNITDKYVPTGAAGFHVDSTAGLAVGDEVIVHRPSPANWIHDIGMDTLNNPWAPGSKNQTYYRIITHIEDNWVQIDAPLTNALDRQYGGGTLYKFRWPGRIEHVGVERLKARSDHTSQTDEDHATSFVTMSNLQNCWVRSVLAMYFVYAAVETAKTARWVTVDTAHCYDPISIITGGRRYPFSGAGQLVLFKNCIARNGRHDFVLNSPSTGPNVFVDGSATLSHADSGPHQRWSTGGLWDNIQVPSNEINFRNRGNYGTGHGWAGANMVAWNCTAKNMIVQNPPTAQNWAIGCVSSRSGNGIFDSHGTPVWPRSLYYAQRDERAAFFGTDYREYLLGDYDNFTPGDPEDQPYVDQDWYNTTLDAFGAGNTPAGFDDLTGKTFLPFSFTYALQPDEVVVGASMTLGLRATGSGVTSDTLYLGSLDNSFSYADLGWLPISGSGSNVRVMDLTSQLALLQGGVLNVCIRENSAVDWARLNLTVALQ